MGLDPVGDHVARAAALDPRHAHDLPEHQAVDLDVAGREVDERRQRLDRGVDRVRPRATGARCGRRRPVTRTVAFRLPMQPTSSAFAVGSITSARSTSRIAGHRSRSGRSALSVIGSSSRPTNSNPDVEVGGVERPGVGRELEHHRERALHVGGAAADHGVALDPAGDVARRGHGVDVTRQEHERRVRPPRAPAGTAGRRRRRPRPRTGAGGTSSRSRARIAASSPLSLGRSTSSSVRAASRRARSSVMRAPGPPGRPSRRRRARPDRSGTPRRPSRRSTSTSPPGNRIVTRAGASPASFAATATAQAPLPHAIVSPDSPLPDADVDPRRRRRARTRRSCPRGTRSWCSSAGPMCPDVVPRGVLVHEQHQMRVAHRDRARREASASGRPRTAGRGTSPTAGPRIGIAAFVKFGAPIPTVTDARRRRRRARASRCFTPARVATSNSSPST